MNDKNEKDNKNVVVLTIIAIATMLIVVAGATFAYLASTRMEKASADINAETNGGDSVFLINAGDTLSIVANETNLKFDENASSIAEKYPYVSDSTTSIVTLMGSNDNTIKYSINLKVDENDFQYTSGKCYTDSSKAAEVNETDIKDNELLCTVNGYTWEKEEVSELVIDILKECDTSDAACTETGGVCVDNKDGRSVVTGKKTQSDCEAANTESTDYEWISNYKDSDNHIYSWFLSKDITEMEATDGSDGVVIADDISLTVGEDLGGGTINKSDVDRYYTSVTMRNLHHNQLVNGSKKFTAQLIFINKSISE